MRTDRREYRAISDYALIGDSHTAALVSSDGCIDWCCWPHLDSPAVFCALLDARRGGWFRVAPVATHTASRSYVDETNVLATTFHTGSGTVRLTDFMPAERRDGQRGEDIEESHRILRLVEGLHGDVELDVSFHPTFDYARGPTTLSINEGGVLASSRDLSLQLDAAMRFAPAEGGGVCGRLRVRSGDRTWLSLHDERSTRDNPEDALRATLSYWREWTSRCTYRGPYESHVRRSALVLKLLTFEPTGALVAAPTTSLPEEIGGVRNWDYRFAWLRDSALVLYALQSIGYHEEAIDFFQWLEAVCLSCQDTIQIMYRLDGSRELPEYILAHLEGYRGSHPVRIGNAAADQTQLDIYGEVLDAAHLCFLSRDLPMPQLGSMLALLADRAAARWQEPDAGIWEVRSGPQHFLYSKLLCWVALDRAVQLAERNHISGDVTHWRQTRDEIRHVILTRGYNEQVRAFTQALDRPELDASALVIPLIGFLPPTDARVRSTVRAIQQQLSANGLIYRYVATDGVAGGEATFALCSFWMVDNLALSGELSEARKLFDRVVSYANDVGLLSEEIDPATGELLGNFPQGFTHLGLIRSALSIAKAEAAGPEIRAERPADRVQPR